MRPKISVVTPNFNGAKYIAECIHSVQTQSYANLEQIVIDNHSTDASVSIIHNLMHRYPRLRVIVAEDKGQSEAINRGVRHSSGEWCSWLNSDDLLEIDALEAVGAHVESNTSAGFLYGECVIVDADGAELYRPDVPEFNLARLSSIGNFICQPSTFVRRDLFIDMGGLNVNLHRCMDYDLWLRLGKRAGGVACKNTLSRFRLHDRSKTCSSQVDFYKEHLIIAHLHRLPVASRMCYNAIKYICKDPARQMLQRAGLLDKRSSFLPKRALR